VTAVTGIASPSNWHPSWERVCPIQSGTNPRCPTAERGRVRAGGPAGGPGDFIRRDTADPAAEPWSLMVFLHPDASQLQVQP